MDETSSFFTFQSFQAESVCYDRSAHYSASGEMWAKAEIFTEIISNLALLFPVGKTDAYLSCTC